MSVHKAFLVRFDALPGQEARLEAFLVDALALARDEPRTTCWFALKLGPASFGVFDAFADEAGRQAHLEGPIAQALMTQGKTMLARPPQIEPVDVIAAKLAA